MKNLSLLVCFLGLMLSPWRAGAAPAEEALRSADDRRVAAMLGADRAGLTDTLSDELHYCHSSGNVDTKASFVEALTSGKLKYSTYEYEQREFSFPAPGVALMTGKLHLKAGTSAGGVDNLMSFLGVWRQEEGKWRFVAWQSSKLAK